MTQFMKRYDNCGQLIDVPPCGGSAPALTGNLILSPQAWSYNGVAYDMTAEGLYAFFNAGVDGGWRIVYQSDIYALMSALCWLTGYGRSDEGQTTSTLTTWAKTRKLSLRCGPTIAWVQSILNSLGIQSRVCRLLTAETPNNYDDGHIVVEVKVNGQWKLWDVSDDRYFVDQGGNHLSLDGYFQALMRFPVTVADPQPDLKGFAGSPMGWNAGVYYDTRLRDVEAWLGRIGQIPGVGTTFYLPPGTGSRESYVTGLGYTVVDYQQWLSMFYP